MSKMIIFNCPAYKGFTKDILDWLDNTNCGQYGGQVPCQSCTDCVLKQIVELCKTIKAINKRNSYVGEYIEFTQKSPLAEEILDLLDIQEVE